MQDKKIEQIFSTAGALVVEVVQNISHPMQSNPIQSHLYYRTCTFDCSKLSLMHQTRPDQTQKMPKTTQMAQIAKVAQNGQKCK